MSIRFKDTEHEECF